ncbi:MAG: hypothetical protein ABIN58_11980 [candidate division WOR-3 bacterium]
MQRVRAISVLVAVLLYLTICPVATPSVLAVILSAFTDSVLLTLGLLAMGVMISAFTPVLGLNTVGAIIL